MKPKVVAIIQARMGSVRLPNKSMLDLAGRPLVDHVIERIKYSKLIDQIVLATPDKEESTPLRQRAMTLGVACFMGSENDLIDRYYQAAKKYDAQVVVRLCADNPLIHASEVDRIIERFFKGDLDFASNVGPVMGNEYPDGLGAEVMSFEALGWAHQNVKDPHCREHPHECFYRNKDRFRLGTVPCPPELRTDEKIVLDINTADEYRFISELFTDLQRGDEPIHISQIIPWYRANYHRIPETYKK